MVKCLGKTNNGDPCIFQNTNDTLFCKNHQYMITYNEDMLTKLELCKGCKKMYYLEGELKTCDICRNRGKKIRKETKEQIVLCAKDSCKFKRSDENKYCGKHQLCVFEDETEAINKKVCYNIIRGCRAQLDLDYQYSKCEECLEKEREKDRKRRAVAVEQNANKETPLKNTLLETKYCTTCCTELSMDYFIGVSVGVTTTCSICRERNKIQNEKRDREHRNETVRNNIKPQYTSYKKGACERILEFKISFDEYESIVNKPCYYCGITQERGFNGIDRVNSSIGYINENCVSCCKMCNYMKGSLSLSVFIKRVNHILTYQNRITGNLYPECFANHKKSTYNQYRNRAVKVGLEFCITPLQYNDITSQCCYICGKINDEFNENGMDRLDNNVGYLIENIKACCAECNCMKINYNFDDILEKFYLIHNKHNDSIILNSETMLRNYRFSNK